LCPSIVNCEHCTTQLPVEIGITIAGITSISPLYTGPALNAAHRVSNEIALLAPCTWGNRQLPMFSLGMTISSPALNVLRFEVSLISQVFGAGNQTTVWRVDLAAPGGTIDCVAQLPLTPTIVGGGAAGPVYDTTAATAEITF
jgi:hypothetical protein